MEILLNLWQIFFCKEFTVKLIYKEFNEQSCIYHRGNWSRRFLSSRIFVKKGYIVHGLVRRSSSYNKRIDHLREDEDSEKCKFFIHYGDMTDTLSLFHVIQKVQPDEIYKFILQSHVAVSFEKPEYTANSDALNNKEILEAVRILGLEKVVFTKPQHQSW